MKVCVIGDVSYNTVIHLDRFPSQKGTFFAKDTYEVIGSSAAGKALNLSNLGHDVTLFSRVGKDEYGQKIKDFFKSWNINTHWIEDSKKTLRHTNLMAKDGSRASIFTTMLDETNRTYFEYFKPFLDSFDTIFLELSSSFRNDIPFFNAYPVWVDLHDYDGKNTFHEPYIDVAGMITFSLENNDDHPFIMKKMNKKPYLYTQGSKGARYYNGSKTLYSESQKVDNIIDTNGAGDAFITAFYTFISDGDKEEFALKKAHAYAALVIQSKTLFP